MSQLLKVDPVGQSIDPDMAPTNNDPRPYNIVKLGDNPTLEMICCVVNFTLV